MTQTSSMRSTIFPLPNDPYSRFFRLRKFSKNKQTHVQSIQFITKTRYRGGARVKVPYFKVLIDNKKPVFVGIHKYGWVESWNRAINALKTHHQLDSGVDISLPLINDYTIS